MREFWHQEFIWFCEQNSEFWKGCPKFRSWWQLWQDEAEKTPISGDENWSCDQLVLAVCTDECTTYSRRVPPETCGFCTLPQTRASPPSMVEKTFSTPEKGGSWPLRAAGGSLALGEGGTHVKCATNLGVLPVTGETPSESVVLQYLTRLHYKLYGQLPMQYLCQLFRRN